ncbi:hypothetical protein [Bradyrhizobium sp. Ghvi]|uniref:hypothetical protein n=1 Tax=Bradyrhizobium sp. Ghvi TaxID=1855319 RepID=UPI001FCD7945|nr:hypothetical protein [Bradyrhizobium sp. Ghvi]
MVAALHQQRAIEARRVLRRYRHLLRSPSETSPLNEFISVRNDEEVSANAYKSATRERAALRPASSVRNLDIVAMALTAALVTLQLVGLAMVERSHARAMEVSFPREATSCAESAAAPVSPIPYD